MSAQPHAAIYCRVSSIGQQDNTSLDSQEQACRELCAREGIPVHEAHVYREVRGGEDLYRPDMERLWDAIAAREVEVVVVDKLDRLSRSAGDQGAFLHHCESHGVQVRFASESLDDSMQGRMLQSLAGIFADIERVQIGMRTQRGRRKRAHDGKLITAPFPKYGYLWGDPAKGKGSRTKYVVDPETAPTVVRIYEQAASGVSIREIARQLEAEGIETPAMVLRRRQQLPTGWPCSAIWSRSGLRRILDDPSYTGEHVVYKSKWVVTKQFDESLGKMRKAKLHRARPLDDPDRLALPESACPALVSAEIAATVRAQLAIQAQDAQRHTHNPEYALFRNFVFCGYCGGMLHMASTIDGNKRYRCFKRAAQGAVVGTPLGKCPGGTVSMSIPVLDAKGWAHVTRTLLNPKLMTQGVAEWKTRQKATRDHTASRLAASDAVLADLDRRIKNKRALAEEVQDAHERRELAGEIDALAERRTLETAKRDELRATSSVTARQASEWATLEDWARTWVGRLPTFTYQQKRLALRALGVRVLLWRTDHVDAESRPQRWAIRYDYEGFNTATDALAARDASWARSTCAAGQP
jgi:DNA invertase Pin-like site-specific DNA recombinase